MNTAIISVFIANPSVLFGTLILEALPGAALAYGLVWWAMRPKDGRKVPSPFLSHAGGVLVAVTGGAVFRIIAMTTFAGRSAYEPVSETGAAGFYILVVPAIVAYAYIAWLKGRLSNQAKPRTTSNSSENAYAEALAEIEEGQMNKGVWARTFAESGGDESKATALYIKARADATKNPAVWEATQPAIAYDTGITTTVEGGSRPLVPSPIYPLRILAGVAAAGVVAIVVIPAYQDYTKRQMASVTTEIPATDWEKGVMTQPPSEAKPPFKVRALALRGRIESGALSSINARVAHSPRASEGYLPKADVAKIEGAQTWWKTGDDISIHIVNSSQFNVASIGIEHAQSSCENSSAFSTFVLQLEQFIEPGKEAVALFHSTTIGAPKEMECLNIVNAWANNPFSDPAFGKELLSSPQTSNPSVASESSKEHYSRIYAAHPDADAIHSSPSFQAWLARYPAYQRIVSKGSTQEIIEMFTAYKNQL